MPRKTKDKTKQDDSQLFNYPKNSYMERTSRPIYALLFLLAFLVFYEVGTILINPATLEQSLNSLEGRVVAFLWVQDLLKYIKFQGRILWIATPLVVVVILLALQITSKKPWKVRIKDFLPMTVECIALAIPLIVLSLAVNSARQPVENSSNIQTNIQTVGSEHIDVKIHDLRAEGTAVRQRSMPQWFIDIVTGIGAGIYEELIFRLVLICLLMLIFQDLLGMSKVNAVILSVLISALTFSLHHHFFYISGSFGRGEPFRWSPFIFRSLAGGYFAFLFAWRGFGITAGTHAYYDIIVAIFRAVVLAGV